MSNCKHRLISGMLTVLCLLTGLAAPAWSHTTEAPALAAASAPDLIIESLALSPESPSIGDMLAFTVTIKNQGDDRAAAEQLACLIDEHPLSTIPVEPVDAGATAVKTVTWKAQAGPHVFRAVIDSNDRVAESNENNNDKTYAFSVLAPDLTIDAISWTPAEPAVGDEVTFSIAVVNRGDKRAGVCHLDFSVDGNSRGYTPIYGVEAGASVNETYTWIATQGVHDVRADIDVFHQVTESDEANNSTEATCATALPDLTISSITMTPDVISENTTVVFYVDITNQGSSRAGSSSVTFYIEDSQKDSDFLGPLEPGATSTANFTWVAGGKPLTFKAVADAYNQIVESDKTNNTGTVVFPKFSPDLMIQDITWSPSSPVLTDFVTCTVTVKNQGKSMSNATQLNFVIDNARHYNALIPELSANTTTTAMFTFMTERLAHTVKASIDDDNLIKESDESNNTMTKTVISTKPVPTADLVVTSFTYSPARPVIGGNITVSLGVKNRGTGKATPTYAAFFFDSSPVDSVYINGYPLKIPIRSKYCWTAIIPSGRPMNRIMKRKLRSLSMHLTWLSSPLPGRRKSRPPAIK
jgi:subtilase family serine protease